MLHLRLLASTQPSRRARERGLLLQHVQSDKSRSIMVRTKNSTVVVGNARCNPILFTTATVSGGVFRVVLHLTSSLHQVHHAVELVSGAQLSRGSVESESPPRAALVLLAAQGYNLHHHRRGMLAAQSRPIALIAPTRDIRAPLLPAPQAFEHVNSVRGVRLTPTGVVHPQSVLYLRLLQSINNNNTHQRTTVEPLPAAGLGPQSLAEKRPDFEELADTTQRQGRKSRRLKTVRAKDRGPSAAAKSLQLKVSKALLFPPPLLVAFRRRLEPCRSPSSLLTLPRLASGQTSGKKYKK